MKILFSLTYYTPYISGLTLYVVRLAEALVRKGHRATVLCMKHEPSLKSQETARGVRVVRATPFARVNKGFFSFDWFRLTWRKVESHDVVIVNLPQAEGFIPALIGRFMGKRVIAVYHCEVVLPDTFFSQIVQTFLEIANSITLLLADTVVTYTRDFARHSRILAPFLRKTSYVYPPIPVPTVRSTVQKRLRAKIGKAAVVIGVAARLAAEKGLEYLFEAIPLIKLRVKSSVFKVVIAGPIEPAGEAAYRKKIHTLVKRYKKHIIFLGSLQPEEMGAFYSLIDILVLPSVNSTEAFGMVQVEAMMMGVPVVASNLPGVRVPIQKTGMGILVPPCNTQALADGIMRILQNPRDFQANPSVIERTFRIEQTVRAYEKLLSR